MHNSQMNPRVKNIYKRIGAIIRYPKKPQMKPGLQKPPKRIGAPKRFQEKARPKIAVAKKINVKRPFSWLG